MLNPVDMRVAAIISLIESTGMNGREPYTGGKPALELA